MNVNGTRSFHANCVNVSRGNLKVGIGYTVVREPLVFGILFTNIDWAGMIARISFFCGS